MEKDKYYLEACEDAREMQAHGYHWTQEIVEQRAKDLRVLDRPQAIRSTESPNEVAAE